MMRRLHVLALGSALLLAGCGAAPVVPVTPSTQSATTAKAVHLRGATAYLYAWNSFLRPGESTPVDLRINSDKKITDMQVQWSCTDGSFNFTYGPRAEYTAGTFPGVAWLRAYVTLTFEDGTRASGTLQTTVQVQPS